MYSSPSPPPSSPPPPLTPPPGKQTHNPNQIVVGMNRQHPSFKAPSLDPTKSLSFRQPRPRRTNPGVWAGAILCFVFSLLLIFFGMATLVTFLVIRPKTPVFDAPSASLSSIYVGSPEYLNGEFTLLANFSNPNGKLDVRFEYVDIELYFSDRLIASKSLQPFSERRGEMRLESIRMVSSLVYLPQGLAMELQKQVVSNKVTYNVRGTFKVRASVGLIHYSYWLHSRCQLDMTSPPAGLLLARTCTTTR